MSIYILKQWKHYNSLFNLQKFILIFDFWQKLFLIMEIYKAFFVLVMTQLYK